MTGCERILSLLDDFADGALPPQETRAVEEHLASCHGCVAALDEIHLLLARAASLPQEVELRRDLWPGIKARIQKDGAGVAPGPGPSAHWHRPIWVLAAAALLVVTMGTTVLLLRQPASPSAHGEASRPAFPAVQTVALRKMGQDYGQARADLLRVIQGRRDLIKPGTRAVVDENLALIDQAVRHIKGALDKDPANRALMDLLKNTYRQEQELLKRAATLPADA